MDSTRRAWIKSAAALAAAGAHSGVTWAQPRAAAQIALPTQARLSLNENAFGCSPQVEAAIRSHLGDLNRYTEHQADELIQQIALKEGVPAEQVVLGDVLAPLGTQLSLAGGRGSEFLYSVPGFTDLVLAAQRAGGTPIGVPLNDKLENDLPALMSRLSTRTRAVYIVNPHNPTGTITPPEVLKTFVSSASRRALVVIDEAYLEYTDDFNTRTLAPFVRDGGNAVVFRTFGKVYGLASLGFGYALVPKDLAQRLRQEGVGAPHSLNMLSIVAAAAALSDTQFVSATRARVKVERARWNSALERLGVAHSDAQASFVFFQTPSTQRSLATTLLSKGVDIGRDFPPLESWARITIGRPEENTLAINALQEILGNRSLAPK